MRFNPNFLDEIRARVPVSQVVGRKVALKKAGREYKGLSPFKTEKTPSFTVNDQKGFYHCFGCGEHGDIFTFLMKTEGLEFPEAVERLAGGDIGEPRFQANVFPQEIEARAEAPPIGHLICRSRFGVIRVTVQTIARDIVRYPLSAGVSAVTLSLSYTL